MNKHVYPYIPSTAPGKKEELLREIGLDSVEDIFKEIPAHLRFNQDLKIPEALLSEFELKKHIEELLSKNRSTKNNLSFLGGGMWQHYVPSVCNTIGSRDEFLTTYQRGAYADHGKLQALFETASMIGDLVEMDAVSSPTYDWANAAAISIRMASRMTGRKKVLISSTISPNRMQVIQNYCKPDISLEMIDHEYATGQLDLVDLEKKITADTAAVYFENPSYLGHIETTGRQISQIAKKNSTEVVVGVDPSSLGVLASPPSYGATIVCGELQPFGLHQQWGGGLAGFIASPDTERYVSEYPSLLYGLAGTVNSSQYGFGQVAFERTSYAKREGGKDFIGTSAALHGIMAGVYLALMGPQGLKELGCGIMQRVMYARDILSLLDGVNAKKVNSPSFKEFIVEFDSSLSVQEINRELLKLGIFGGVDLSKDFFQFGNAALYSITEIHSKDNIDKLAWSINKVLSTTKRGD